MSLSRLFRLAPLVAVVVIALAAPAVAVAPHQVPDRVPLLAEPLRRGAVVATNAPARTPSAKTTDGNPTDWAGAATGISGTARLDRGEHV